MSVFFCVSFFCVEFSYAILMQKDENEGSNLDLQKILGFFSDPMHCFSIILDPPDHFENDTKPDHAILNASSSNSPVNNIQPASMNLP